MGSSRNDDDGESKEEQEEQERLRQEAIKQAERERAQKYRKQEEEREGMRQNIRDKVRQKPEMKWHFSPLPVLQYGIEKKVNEDEDEDEDEDDEFGASAKKPEEIDDPVLRKHTIFVLDKLSDQILNFFCRGQNDGRTAAEQP